MDVKFEIPGKWPSLNEYIDQCKIKRNRWNAGNSMKRRDQAKLVRLINTQKRKIKPPVYIEYRFFCGDRRRDLDNVSGYFHKIFQDALVDAGVIPDDSWRYVVGFSDSFALDPGHDHVVVRVREVGE